MLIGLVLAIIYTFFARREIHVSVRVMFAVCWVFLWPFLAILLVVEKFRIVLGVTLVVPADPEAPAGHLPLVDHQPQADVHLVDHNYGAQAQRNVPTSFATPNFAGAATKETRLNSQVRAFLNWDSEGGQLWDIARLSDFSSKGSNPSFKSRTSGSSELGYCEPALAFPPVLNKPYPKQLIDLEDARPTTPSFVSTVTTGDLKVLEDLDSNGPVGEALGTTAEAMRPQRPFWDPYASMSYWAHQLNILGLRNPAELLPKLVPDPVKPDPIDAKKDVEAAADDLGAAAASAEKDVLTKPGEQTGDFLADAKKVNELDPIVPEVPNVPKKPFVAQPKPQKCVTEKNLGLPVTLKGRKGSSFRVGVQSKFFQNINYFLSLQVF